MTVVEIVIHDEIAESLKHLFLPPAGSHVTASELQIACARLAEATRAVKRLQRLTAVGETLGS
jgi:hypothetical protein